jgi:hypothetical protein
MHDWAMTLISSLIAHLDYYINPPCQNYDTIRGVTKANLIPSIIREKGLVDGIGHRTSIVAVTVTCQWFQFCSAGRAPEQPLQYSKPWTQFVDFGNLFNFRRLLHVPQHYRQKWLMWSVLRIFFKAKGRNRFCKRLYPQWQFWKYLQVERPIACGPPSLWTNRCVPVTRRWHRSLLAANSGFFTSTAFGDQICRRPSYHIFIFYGNCSFFPNFSFDMNTWSHCLPRVYLRTQVHGGYIPPTSRSSRTSYFTSFHTYNPLCFSNSNARQAGTRKVLSQFLR